MVIKTLEIDGYGKLHNLSVEFNEGFNLIYGVNEAGKTTLIRCIFSLLYGQSALDADGQNENDLMRPWDSSPYRASMTYELDNGNVYRVFRDFDTNDVRIFDETNQQEITDQFETDAGGNPLFAKEQLGLPKSSFLSTVLIQQEKMSKIEDIKGLSTKIMALADAADEENTYLVSIGRLKKAISEIGSENDESSLLGSTVSVLNSNQDNGMELDRLREEMEDMSRERYILYDRLKTGEKELSRLDYIVKSLDREHIDSIIGQVEDIDRRVRDMKTEESDISEDSDIIEEFPAAGIEEEPKPAGISESDRAKVLSLQSDIRVIKSRISELEQKLEEKHRKLEEEQAKLEGREKILDTDSAVIEGILLSGASSDTRSTVVSSRKKLLEDIKEKIGEVSAHLKEEKDKFEEFQGKDPEKFEARITELSAKTAKEEVLKLQEVELARTGQHLALLESGMRSRFISTVVLMLVGAFIAIYALDRGALGNFGLNAESFLFLIGVIFFISGTIIGFSFQKQRREIMLTDENLRKKASEVNQMKDELAEAQVQMKEMLGMFGASSAEELRKIYASQSGTKVELSALESQAKALEEEIESLSGQAFESPVARNVFKELGYLNSEEETPGRELLERFQEDYDRAREARRHIDSLDTEKQALEEEISHLSGELAEIQEKIDDITRGQDPATLAEVPSARPAITAEAQNGGNGNLTELLERRKILLRGKSLDSRRDRLKKLDSAIEELLRANPELKELNPSSFDREETFEEMERRREELVDIKSRIPALEIRIEAMERKMGDGVSPEKVEELVSQRDKLLKNRHALIMAKDMIKEVGRKYHKQYFAPQLSRSMTELLKKITEKYDTVTIDDELNISVKANTAGEWVQSQSLSKGALDQLYFSLRLGIAEMLSGENIVLPLVMEDPFTQFDENRKKRSLEILLEMEMERGRQILFLTCSSKLKQEFARMLRDKSRIAKLTHLDTLELIKPENKTA